MLVNIKQRSSKTNSYIRGQKSFLYSSKLYTLLFYYYGKQTSTGF